MARRTAALMRSANLRDAARYRPARDRFKIYILDEAHQITDAALCIAQDFGRAAASYHFHDGHHPAEDIPQTIRSRWPALQFSRGQV